MRPRLRPRGFIAYDASMSAAEKLKTTYAEYLALELSSGVRHEFVDGFAYAMAGGEPEHARLALSIGAELRKVHGPEGVPLGIVERLPHQRRARRRTARRSTPSSPTSSLSSCTAA